MKEIRSAPCPDCIICGNKGKRLHSNLNDRLFSAPGRWSLNACSSGDCGLLWPDPMPLAEDIGIAYATYYTHAAPQSKSGGLLRSCLRLIVRSYWSIKYGYPAPRYSLAGGLGWLLYLFPLRRSTADQDVRLLSTVSGGRVLDVGCGSGDWLLQMKQLGWKTQGVDFDAKATEAAQERNLEVECGTLEEQNYSPASFDAVTLNHVIEHVPDPLASLHECFRLLKPGGKIVLFTPNSVSASHRFFRENWRGLEPPRHLHIFDPKSLRNVLQKAGFTDVCIHPIIAESVISESLRLSWGAAGTSKQRPMSRSIWVLTQVFLLLEICLVKVMPSKSDCIGAIAVKR